MGRSARIDESSSSSKREQPAAKKGKAKKGGKAQTPELAHDLEDARPSILDISSNTTETETVPQETVGEGENSKEKKIAYKIKR